MEGNPIPIPLPIVRQSSQLLTGRSLDTEVEKSYPRWILFPDLLWLMGLRKD